NFAEITGWDENDRRNFTPLQFRKCILQNADKTIIKRDGDVMRASFQRTIEISGDWFRATQQFVHLRSKALAFLCRNGVIVKDHGAARSFSSECEFGQ